MVEKRREIEGERASLIERTANLFKSTDEEKPKLEVNFTHFLKIIFIIYQRRKFEEFLRKFRA